MKTTGTIIGTIIALLFFGGCTFAVIQMPGCQQELSHVVSYVAGYDRTVTLYANDGSIIKKWEGVFQVVVNGATARFISDGCIIEISGTFLIEEIEK